MLPDYFLDYLADLAALGTQELAAEFEAWTYNDDEAEAPESFRVAAVRRILAINPDVADLCGRAA